MYKALLLDFYGTLVEEDSEVIAGIVERIAEASPSAPRPQDVAVSWNVLFSGLCSEAFGPRFRPQRELEQESLSHLLAEYASPLDAEELSEELFAYWVHPAPLNGVATFLSEIEMPICIVSNIDTGDLAAALSHLGWRFDHVITSEACRSYKPRREPFEAALSALGCAPDAVLHVGDSISSDLAGAAAAGIAAAWVNSGGRPLPADIDFAPAHILSNVSDLARLLHGDR